VQREELAVGNVPVLGVGLEQRHHLRVVHAEHRVGEGGVGLGQHVGQPRDRLAALRAALEVGLPGLLAAEDLQRVAGQAVQRHDPAVVRDGQGGHRAEVEVAAALRHRAQRGEQVDAAGGDDGDGEHPRRAAPPRLRRRRLGRGAAGLLAPRLLA
jgi:hypothetical protein